MNSVRPQNLIAILLGLMVGTILLRLEIDLGLTVRFSDLFLLMACGVLCIALMQGQRMMIAFPALLTSSLYASYVFLNASAFSGQGVAVKEFIQLTLFIGFFFAGTLAWSDDRMFIRWFTIAIVMICGVAAWNAIYHIVALGVLSGWKELDEPKLAHGVSVALLVGATMSGRRWPAWWWGLVASMIVLMILSGERKGWIAALAAIAAMTFVSEHGRLSRKSIGRMGQFVIFGALAFLVILPIAQFFPYLDKQISSIGDFASGIFGTEAPSAETTRSNQVRLFGINFAISLFLDNPVFGAGIEQYVRALDRLPVEEIYKKGAHNEILRILAEGGLVGLTLYLSIYAATLFRAVILARGAGRLTPVQVMRLRLGMGMMVYGFIINIFLGGGGINLFFVFLPVGLIFSVPLPAAAPPGPLRTGFSGAMRTGASVRT